MRWLWLSLALVACGTASEDVSTSTLPVEAADAPPGPAVDETPLVIAGPTRRLDYSPNAPFTALSFVAKEGEDIAFLVDARTEGTKPVVWITDNQFVTIASAAPASGTAYVRFTANRAGIFYFVLREAALEPSQYWIRSFVR